MIDNQLAELLKQRALSGASTDLNSAKEYADYLLRVREIDLKSAEARKWTNPILVTISAGLLTIAGNTVLQSFNAAEQRNSDAIKHQQTLFVEAFKAPTPEAALRNLEFLLDTGVLDKKRYSELQAHIDSARAENRGPIISSTPSRRIVSECRVPDSAKRYEQQAKAAGSWKWMEHALNDMCVDEDGPQAHQDRIVEYLQSTASLSSQTLTPQIPWATAFVVWALKRAKVNGVPNTAIASGFANFGESLPTPKFGCILLVRRLAPQLSTVGFYIDQAPSGARVLMGNASNSVRIITIPKANVGECRMPKQES